MDHVRPRVFVPVALLAIVGIVCASGVTGAGAAAADGTEGVSAKSIKIGYIFSKTGVASSNYSTADKGCQARVGRENADGGVNGRKIEVEYLDDQSSGANLTGSQDLVQNKHVFMVVNNSSFAFLTYRWMKEHGVPMVGSGVDGTYYGEPGNEGIINPLGNVVSANGVTWDTLPRVMKKMGATKVAALGYGVSASSSLAAENLNKFGVPKVGLQAAYTNKSVDFGSTDVGPLVLGIKNSGADAVYLPMVANTNVAIVQGLAQNGVKMKSTVLATGYGQALLDQPVSRTFGPEVLLQTGFAPIELKTKATKQFVADLEKYADFNEVPDFGVYTGYITCDLAILGLENAGNPPTRSAFAPNLRKLKTYDQAGLGCRPVDISLETYGQAAKDSCLWFVQVKNGKFVPYPANGKPWTGRLIEESTVTTTTAPQ